MECLTQCIRDKTAWCKLKKPVKEVDDLSWSDIMVCFRLFLNSFEHHSHDCTLFMFI